MISTLLKWAGFLLFAVAAVLVGLSIWAGVRGDSWGASSFVYTFGPVVAGLVLVGLSRMMDDVAAIRQSVEREGEPPPPPGAG